MNRKLILSATWLVLLGLVLSACMPVSPAATEMTLYVGPTMVDCQGAGPQKCLLVKEDPDSEYTLFYDSIQGFDYEEGYEYELRVRRETVPNPPADASSFKWTLVEVVSKTPVESEAQAGTAALEGTQWELQSYVNTNGETMQAVPGVEATATFEDGAVNGTTGCNNYFGTYTVEGSNLSIEVGGMTMMACPEPLMAQEMEFVGAMNSTSTYEITGNDLMLSDADGNIVVTFSVLEPVSLTGTNWVATGYNNGKGGVVSITIGTEITALFGEDGTLSGSASCNNYSASYQVDGQAIQIGPAATTRMMCSEPEGIMEQETLYLAALDMAEVYRIESNRLEFRTSEGSLVVSYEAQPDMPGEAENTGSSSAVDAEIVDVTWKWQGSQYNNDTSAVPDNAEDYTLELKTDGSAAVQADCNRAGGTYALDGSQITIEILSSTMAMCPEGSLEGQYLQDLNAAVIYFMQDGDLFLDMKMDTGTMRFSR